jgi:hypothetical protein
MGVYSGYCRERTYRAYAPPSSRGAAGRVVAGRPVRVSRARPPTPPRSRSRTPPRRGTPPATSSDGSSTVRALLHRGGLTRRPLNSPSYRFESVSDIARIRTRRSGRRTTSSGALEPLARCVPHTGPARWVYVVPAYIAFVRLIIADDRGTGGRSADRGGATRTTYDVRACRCQPGKIVLT